MVYYEAPQPVAILRVIYEENKKLKKRNHILHELNHTVCIYELFSAEHEEALSKYEEIWSSYQAKYDSFERAQELQTKQKELELLESQSEPMNCVVKNIIFTNTTHYWYTQYFCYIILLDAILHADDGLKRQINELETSVSYLQIQNGKCSIDPSSWQRVWSMHLYV